MRQFMEIIMHRFLTRLHPGSIIALGAMAHCGCTIEVNTSEPTMVYRSEAAAPPLDDDRTIVLFDGKNWVGGWKQRDGSASKWELQEDGSVKVAGGVHESNVGDAVSAEEFGDFQLHVEFICPLTQGKEGQAKSNSGVYLHGRYEVQVLDSHGAPPADNLCGGIYKIAPPLVNAAKPAGQWQSYDIVFRAPRFDEQKELTEQPRITVLHNGVVIHNNLSLPRTTGGALGTEMVERGPILLQVHGDPVRYRNIWIMLL
jgi:hypothetical protein